jgi:hypothetical protein
MRRAPKKRDDWLASYTDRNTWSFLPSFGTRILAIELRHDVVFLDPVPDFGLLHVLGMGISIAPLERASCLGDRSVRARRAAVRPQSRSLPYRDADRFASLWESSDKRKLQAGLPAPDDA